MICVDKRPTPAPQPNGVSQVAGEIARPQIGRDRGRVRFDAVAREVPADALYIAREQRVDFRVVARVKRLGEVYDGDLAAVAVVQDVVRREVAVDAVAGQEQLDVAQDALEERSRLFRRQLRLAQ